MNNRQTKKVVWGTGWIATKYVGALSEDDIDFFIDSNEQKRKTRFLGREVKMPDEIDVWEDLAIYIQHNYYDEIANILKQKGLKENVHYFKYEEPKQIIIKNKTGDFDKILMYVQENQNSSVGKNWYWGATIFSNLIYRDFIKLLQDRLQEEFLTISEAVYIKQVESERRWKMPIIVLPKIFGTDSFQVVSEELDKYNYKSSLNKEFPELMENAKEYRKMYPQLQEGEEYAYTYAQAIFIEKLMLILKPRRVFIMCSYLITHRILAKLCRKHNVPVIYTHRGALPKTWSMEVGGEMGESLPAVYAEKFLNLPITKEDISNAQKVWSYLKASRINRKIQPKNNWMEKIEEKIEPNRPIVFFAGQNDVHSGLVYYSEHAKKYHSPIFTSSIAAVPFLAELAKKNNWNFLYKPHPMYMPTEEEIKNLPDNVIYVEQADINEIIDYSDLTITILSSTAYVALIREKPVLMLGYNQLKGKECTYEAFVKEQIEDKIQYALKEGLTDKQKEAFSKHIAQLLKYYLYEDSCGEGMKYGRQLPQSVKEFYELAELLGVEEGV